MGNDCRPRRVPLHLKKYVAVGHILLYTDLVATVPERLAERMAVPFELRYLAHPVKLPKIAINMFWHAKFHKDPANQWLRSLVFDLHADASTGARA